MTDEEEKDITVLSEGVEKPNVTAVQYVTKWSNPQP